MHVGEPRHCPRALVLSACLACGNDVGSTEGATTETGTGGPDAGEDPGPDGPGCDAPWEGWWAEAQGDDPVPTTLLADPEAQGQRGRWYSSAPLTGQLTSEQASGTGRFRATLISEAAVLSTGRNLAVSWCLGAIFPNPQGPGGVVDEELEAINLERYEGFRAGLERATRVWERHSKMNFVHLAGLDDRRKPSGGSCDTALEHIWFRAQTRKCNLKFQGQTNANGANEFDPDAASPENPDGYPRLLCIMWQVFEGAKSQISHYAGHESGHIVGLDHEHIRWNQSESLFNSCKDSVGAISSDRILTPADPWSVMGYSECEGSEYAKDISAADMLGAYYIFNWTNRRVRDMAPATGGRSQRLWADDLRPGLLWYVPFSDSLVEWRFDPTLPGPLSFSTVERCLDGATPPCSGPVDSHGHWRPVVGQFTGSSEALDVFMHGPGDASDLLLRNDSPSSFAATPTQAPGRAIPVVGNFGPGNRDQILWYRPGPAPDELWVFDTDGEHTTLPMDQDGWRIPIPGHFRSRTHSADIIWFDPRDASLDRWRFTQDYSVLKSGPGSAALLGVVEATEYLPIVGNFDGDNRTDMFWYTPGSAADWLWLSTSNQEAMLFDSYEFAVDGEYLPIVGDFDADGDDDIFWYRPAVEREAGPSRIWYFDGPSVDVRSMTIYGDYVPYAEDFDSDGCTDVLWYDPVTPAATSPLWRCLPTEKTFACDVHLPAPKTAFPIGLATGGY